MVLIMYTMPWIGLSDICVISLVPRLPIFSMYMRQKGAWDTQSCNLSYPIESL